MAKDLVERLRTQPPVDLSGDTHDLRQDAANKIERQRSALQSAKAYMEQQQGEWLPDGSWKP